MCLWRTLPELFWESGSSLLLLMRAKVSPPFSGQERHQISSKHCALWASLPGWVESLPHKPSSTSSGELVSQVSLGKGAKNLLVIPAQPSPNISNNLSAFQLVSCSWDSCHACIVRAISSQATACQVKLNNELQYFTRHLVWTGCLPFLHQASIFLKFLWGKERKISHLGGFTNLLKGCFGKRALIILSTIHAFITQFDPKTF